MSMEAALSALLLEWITIRRLHHTKTLHERSAQSDCEAVASEKILRALARLHYRAHPWCLVPAAAASLFFREHFTSSARSTANPVLPDKAIGIKWWKQCPF